MAHSTFSVSPQRRGHKVARVRHLVLSVLENNATKNGYGEFSPVSSLHPTLCRSTTLTAETAISKWRVTTTIRQLLQLPTGGTPAFGVLRAIASLRPHSNFLDVPVFQSHQLTFYGNECLKWEIPTHLP